MLSEEQIPFGVPLIVQFQYMQDCQVKIPVSIKEQDGSFFLKMPVRPEPEWRLNLIVRSVQFPQKYPVKIYRSPFGETDYWESQVLEKIAHSQFAEIYSISTPGYFNISVKRKAGKRFFCLTPVKCLLGDSAVSYGATCVDVSQQGIGLKFPGQFVGEIGEHITITFEQPLAELPSLKGEIVRKNFNQLDASTTIGLLIPAQYQHATMQAIKLISQKQQSDAFTLDNPTNQVSTNHNLFNLF